MSNLGTAILCLMSACGVTQLVSGYQPEFAAVAPPVLEGTTSNCAAGERAPAAAESAGFTKMVFCDDFDSLSTIDVHTTGAPGFNWYTRMPFNRGRTSETDYSVSNSVLSVTDDDNYNWGIASIDPKTGSGKAWNFGYFEARLSFDPNAAPDGPGWPSWWADSAYHFRYETQDTGGLFEELDFLEVPRANRQAFAGTLHEWAQGMAVHYRNSENYARASVNWGQWHTVGVLWVRGSVIWYLDGKPVIKQQYSQHAPPRPIGLQKGTIPSPAGVFAELDSERLGEFMILGSAKGWPLNVDWVRVWH